MKIIKNMKKLYNILMAAAIALGTFTSCEDVPMPFNNPLDNLKPEPDVVVIDPAGDGTKDNPYNVAGVIAYLNTLEADVESPNDIYVKGIVTSVKEAFSTQYGNAQFVMSDTDEGTNQFTFYRGLYLGNVKYKNESDVNVDEGDVVVICGKIVNYRGSTPETVQNKAYVVSINGKTVEVPETKTGEAKGTGTQADPYNVAGVLNLLNGLGADVTSSNAVYIKGKVKTITEQFGTQFGNATFTMVDEGYDAVFTAYRVLYLGNKKYTEGDVLNEGDEVIVCGKVVNFKGNTPETAQNTGYLYSLNGKTGDNGGETPSSSDLGTKDAPLTVAKALDVINALADNGETETEAFVKGKISKVQSYSDKYKSITYYISDDGTETKELQIYSGKNVGGAEFASQDDLSVGDEVVVKGKLKKFMKNGEAIPEMNQPNEIIAITKVGGGDTPSGATGLEASFASGEGNFTIEDKEIGSLSFVWKADTKNGYMKASAFVNNANNAAESWLVSPSFSLKGVNAPVMTFNNACNFIKEGVITDHIKVMVFDGANWTEATIADMPDGKSWTFVDSTVDLKAIAGKEGVKVAFKYVSTTAVAPTWEIKSVTIK